MTSTTPRLYKINKKLEETISSCYSDVSVTVGGIFVADAGKYAQLVQPQKIHQMQTLTVQVLLSQQLEVQLQ